MSQLEANKAKKVTDKEEPGKSQSIRKTVQMLYFTTKPGNNDKQEFVDGSMFLTKEMANELENVIPHRVVSNGWKMAFSRIRDGASYET